MKERARVMAANAHVTKLEMNELFKHIQEILGGRNEPTD
jgi:hypothetical protein